MTLSPEKQLRLDQEFLDDARWVSRKSEDRSTKHGCVIVNDRQVVLSTGWNGFPRGIRGDIEARHERPAKYMWTEHSERNAIYNAAAEGVSLRGSTAYITGLPCCDCARGLIQSGITRVVYLAQTVNWNHPDATVQHEVSLALFNEAGVSLTEVDPAPTQTPHQINLRQNTNGGAISIILPPISRKT